MESRRAGFYRGDVSNLFDFLGKKDITITERGVLSEHILIHIVFVRYILITFLTPMWYTGVPMRASKREYNAELFCREEKLCM